MKNLRRLIERTANSVRNYIDKWALIGHPESIDLI
jgi:hypothetical protein